MGILLSNVNKTGQARRRFSGAGLALSFFLAAVTGLVSCEKSGDKIEAPPGIEIKNPEIVSKGGQQFMSVTATASWTLTITDDSGTEDPDWLSVNRTSGEGSVDVTLTVRENTSEESRSATITVTSAGGSAKSVITQAGAQKKTPDPTPTPGRGGNLTNATKWLELPAISDGTDAFTHSMTIGTVKTRNYSFVWDYSNLVAPWVAYPLCKWNIGSGSRTNAWRLDPLLKEEDQPVLYRGYSEGNSGWYARGHQIPSADRLVYSDREQYSGNHQTFYGTNMTPQLNDNFNGTIWANLESSVRSWANRSDTLYVVTGCVIDYKKGETVKYVLDNVGKKVTVPTAYYKVVLRYMKNSTIGYSGYCACAVWMDHKAYSSKNVDKSYSMSVDALEKKLGMDFFVNLPSAVGEETAAKIEAEDPSKVSWWW
jgi:DNA/RNA endonuclease G (NUC1)